MIISAGYEAFAIIQTFTGNSPPFYWPLLAFLLFAGLVGWVIYDLQHKLEQILNTRPNIVLGPIDQHFQGTVNSNYWSDLYHSWIISKSEHPFFTRIWISNKPKEIELGVMAEDLASHIEFWDEFYQKCLFSMRGRWAETKQAIQNAGTLDTKQIDIPPNASEFCLDIGIKYFEEDVFYAYNDESQYGKSGGRDKDKEIKQGTHIIRVRIRGKGVDVSFWFELHNPGSNANVSLIAIPSPSSDKVGSLTQ